MLQNNTKMKSLIDGLWNTFWSGGISNPLTAIEQISYLLFIKRLDEIEAKRERDAEWTGEKYNSRFEGKYFPYVDESLYQVDDKNGKRTTFKSGASLVFSTHVDACRENVRTYPL
jgi:type I restriction enzyme M protein